MIRSRTLMPLIPALVAAVLLAWLPARAAEAPNLDELRRDGVVGERWDGLAVVRAEGAPGTVRTLVESVNAKRLEIYGARAKAQGAPVEEVGKVYAKEIFEKAPAGTWFLGEDRQWVRKE
jgi:uncharacterized protein